MALEQFNAKQGEAAGAVDIDERFRTQQAARSGQEGPCLEEEAGKDADGILVHSGGVLVLLTRAASTRRKGLGWT